MNAQQQRNKAIATLAAQRAGINPNIFDEQMAVEANFQDETSPAGAVGPAQLMPATAAAEHVNPHDPQSAYGGAAHLMAGYLHQFDGSWSKALQAYNAGPGNVGKPLYAETRNYINRILGGPDIVDSGGGPASGGAAPAGPPSVTPIKGSMSLSVDDPALERQKFFAQWFAQRNPSSPLLKLGVLDPNMGTTKTEPLSYIKGYSVKTPAGGAGALGGGATTPAVSSKGGYVAHFEGEPVASWIVPVLQYARAHGWAGKVTSGYRTAAQQAAIDAGPHYGNNTNHSNHELNAFPGGAIDASEAAQLAAIISRSPYAGKLVWAGAKDPVHFSHPHNGSY